MIAPATNARAGIFRCTRRKTNKRKRPPPRRHPSDGRVETIHVSASPNATPHSARARGVETSPQRNSVSIDHTKHAETQMCEKYDPPLMRHVELAISDAPASAPAHVRAASGTRRRATRAAPTVKMPRLVGPASGSSLSHTNGTMKSGHPGVYWEKRRPW